VLGVVCNVPVPLNVVAYVAVYVIRSTKGEGRGPENPPCCVLTKKLDLNVTLLYGIIKPAGISHVEPVRDAVPPYAAL
jgi:hypothetical protein